LKLGYRSHLNAANVDFNLIGFAHGRCDTAGRINLPGPFVEGSRWSRGRNPRAGRRVKILGDQWPVRILEDLVPLSNCCMARL
jgi:hypothetical protein